MWLPEPVIGVTFAQVSHRGMVTALDAGGRSVLGTRDCRAEKLRQAPMRKIPTKNMESRIFDPMRIRANRCQVV
jgi:hypothetical protein